MPAEKLLLMTESAASQITTTLSQLKIRVLVDWSEIEIREILSSMLS
ncbi:hypothetical protein PF70_03503 [Pseudomonas asplenii]|nr:hypothetical protein PF70_03503 [Pseudomonas fuscovaginae]